MTLARWIRATWIGWAAGVPLIALFALLGEAMGIGGAQVLVGVGMGTGIGVAQGRALRGTSDRMTPWVLSCAVGLGIPFFVTDVLRVTGHDTRYSLQLAVAFGGVTVGAWQAYLLRRRVARPLWWIPASGLGWTLAAMAAGSADTFFRAHAIRGLAGAVIYLGIIAVGGVVLAVPTGLALIQMIRPASAQANTTGG
jgi:hypothetical protein